MRVLALRGAHVIGTARTLERGQEACASIEGKATPVVLEFSDFDSVVACAAAIRALDAADRRARLQRRRAADGAAAGARPRDAIRRQSLGALHSRQPLARPRDGGAAGPRRRRRQHGAPQAPPGGIQFDNLSGQGWERQAYGHSKLANGLFSFELAKRLQGTRATSNSLHPGVVATNIMRNLNFTPPAGGGNRGGGGGGFTFEQPAQGAATSCYLASHPSLAGVTGLYFVDCNPAEPSALQKDPAIAARLWQVSEELTRPYLVRSRRRASSQPRAFAEVEPGLLQAVQQRRRAAAGRSARGRSSRQLRFRSSAPRASSRVRASAAAASSPHSPAAAAVTMCAMNHSFASICSRLRQRLARLAVLQIGEHVRQVEHRARLRRVSSMRARDELEAMHRRRRRRSAGCRASPSISGLFGSSASVPRAVATNAGSPRSTERASAPRSPRRSCCPTRAPCARPHAPG